MGTWSPAAQPRACGAGDPSRGWAGRSDCDLPGPSLAGTVMLQGSCWPSVSVPGPLPPGVTTAEAAVSGAVGVGRPSRERASYGSGRDGEPAGPGRGALGVGGTRRPAQGRVYAGASSHRFGSAEFEVSWGCRFRVEGFVPSGGGQAGASAPSRREKVGTGASGPLKEPKGDVRTQVRGRGTWGPRAEEVRL